MPSIDCLDEITINAPPEKVFNTVLDYPNWNTWNKHYYCKLIDGDTVQEGCTINHQFGPKPIVFSEFNRKIDRIESNSEIRERYIEGMLFGLGVWRFEPVNINGEVSTKTSYLCQVESRHWLTHISFVLVGNESHSMVFRNLLKQLKLHCEK